MHVTNFIHLTKRDMCHNVTIDGKKVRKIVRHGLGVGISDTADKGEMRISDCESLYYIIGWLLHAALKAVK